MKALIKSFKRTNWFKATLAFITCFCFLIFPSCQKDKSDQDLILDPYGISSFASSQKNKINYGKLKDVEGNVYKTVKIGKQWWMAENLKTTKLNNGTTIPNIEAEAAWYNRTEFAYCWYGNDIVNKDIYGALYNWFTVNTDKLCPKGWHVSTVSDWEILINYLGPEVAGIKIKETGTDHWAFSEYAIGTNESGFTALPSGVRWFGSFSDFFLLHYRGSWWTSTEYSSSDAYFHDLRYDMPMIGGAGAHPKVNGNSVRCVKK